jgi:hypothetical protein
MLFSEGQAHKYLHAKLLRSLVGSSGEKRAMNNEYFFVRALLSRQPKLFALYGKSTLGEIFPKHITECVRQWRVPSIGET